MNRRLSTHTHLFKLIKLDKIKVFYIFDILFNSTLSTLFVLPQREVICSNVFLANTNKILFCVGFLVRQLHNNKKAKLKI